MSSPTPGARFEDGRGVIEDLLVHPLDSVTRIFTRAGAVRGNHVHEHTTQWTYVLSGLLLIVTEHPPDPADGPLPPLRSSRDYGPGQMACELPGVPHAWRALEDTTVLVFTAGPRSGAGYESDTRRLEVPLI